VTKINAIAIFPDSHGVFQAKHPKKVFEKKYLPST